MRTVFGARILSGVILLAGASAIANRPASEEFEIITGAAGGRGGRLVIGSRAEPKTFNPVTALDTASREIISLLTADLIHVDRGSFRPVAALARSWARSADGRRYTIELRRGLFFSDGQPFDADDVIFTFKVHLDERFHSAQRELLIMDGKPISVTRLDAYRIVIELPRPYAAADRLFDDIAILPKHLLEQSYNDGSLASAWNVTTSPSAIAGMGPFRVKSYVPGQQLVLERNPHYWKTDAQGNRLP
jgi:peptide/nickel transport system substrate-binding protein